MILIERRSVFFGITLTLDTRFPGRFPQGNLPDDAGIVQVAKHRFPDGFADIAEAPARFPDWKLLLQVFRNP